MSDEPNTVPPNVVTNVADGQIVRVTRTWEGVVQRTRTRTANQTRTAFARYAQDFNLDSEVHGLLNLSTDYAGQTIELLEGHASPFKAGDVIEHSEYGRMMAAFGRFGTRERVHFTAADGRRYPAGLVLARGTYRWLVRG